MSDTLGEKDLTAADALLLANVQDCETKGGNEKINTATERENSVPSRNTSHGLYYQQT